MFDNRKKDYFAGFAWAVPKAFRDSLALCRFEQGDVFYDNIKAYEATWNDALNHIKFSIQVKSLSSLLPIPEKNEEIQIESLDSLLPISEKNEKTIFSENWHKSVVVDLTEYPSKKTRSISSTQGRIYTTLWKGGIKYLEKNTPEAPVPKLANEALCDLQSTLNWFLKHHCCRLQHPVIFIMPYDETREILREKYKRIKQNLTHDFQTQFFLIDPNEAGLLNASDFVPTFQIACFVVDTSKTKDVVACLKDATYVPSKEKRTGKDNFSLERHGYLYPKIDKISLGIH